MNMALDEVLLQRKSDIPTLRFYEWDTPSVSIGMAQSVDKHINVNHCRTEGVPVFRRLTGGKAVLHDNELTYSLTGSKKALPFSLSLLDAYCEIGKAFCHGLKKLGIGAILAERNTPPLKGMISSCFAAASSYEVTVAGKKMLGSAQKRTQDKVLQHGSLLFKYNASAWANVMKNSPENMQNKATDLQSHLSPLPSVAQIHQALCDGFQAVFGIKFERNEYTKSEYSLAIKLAKEKYFNLADCLDNNCD